MKTEIQGADHDDLVRRVLDSAPVSRIILFGSAATGNAGAHSDLDVLAVVPDGTHRRQTANAIYRALWGSINWDSIYPDSATVSVSEVNMIRCDISGYTVTCATDGKGAQWSHQLKP